MVRIVEAGCKLFYFSEVAAWAKLLEDVVIIGGLDDIDYFHDIGVHQRSVNGDLQFYGSGSVGVGLHLVEKVGTFGSLDYLGGEGGVGGVVVSFIDCCVCAGA